MKTLYEFVKDGCATGLEPEVCPNGEDAVTVRGIGTSEYATLCVDRSKVGDRIISRDSWLNREVILDVPARFFDDHCDRDLFEGEIVKRLDKKVRIRATIEQLEELRSDASHYSDQATANQMGMPGLASSARATLRLLTSVLDSESKI